MARQKVCKQGRDDIIVKVNLLSPIPLHYNCKVVWKRCGWGFVNLPYYYIIPTFLYTFWHPYIFLLLHFKCFFKSCFDMVNHLDTVETRHMLTPNTCRVHQPSIAKSWAGGLMRSISCSMRSVSYSMKFICWQHQGVWQPGTSSVGKYKNPLIFHPYNQLYLV